MFFMIIDCDNCGISFKTLPSWYKRTKHHYCGMSCYLVGSREARTRTILAVGADTRFAPGQKPSPNRRIHSGAAHHAWKQAGVSYRGLHYWVRRQKGSPEKCVKCGERNKRLQWANIDGRYRREADDFVAMCVSCHKYHDLALKRASPGSPNTT